MSLDMFFYPKSIAIIGASNNPNKAGYQIANNMVRLNFKGKVFFVNPNEDIVFGQKAYKSLLEIKEPVDLIEIIIPAKGVLEVFEQAAKRGDVKGAIIMASGFSETGLPENIEIERKILDIAQEADIRVFGPNCVGVMNTDNNLDTTFAPNIKQMPGGMSIISQSGSIASAILMFCGDQPVPMGFSKWGHVGNMSDVNTEELLDYYMKDEKTKVISVYMEGMTDARTFFNTVKEVIPKKPLLVLKVGRSEIGSVAAASHTGSLAGSDKIFDGAFAQYGVIRTDTVEELIDTSKVFSMVDIPKGNRIAILTEAGGAGVIAMDEIGFDGVAQMAEFSKETEKKLKEILPDMALISKPVGYVDMTAAADGPQHAEALEVILKDENVDAILLLSVPPTFLKPADVAKHIITKTQLAKKLGKPILACFLAGNWINEACSIMENEGIPTFEMPQRAAKALTNLIKRSEYLKSRR